MARAAGRPANVAALYRNALRRFQRAGLSFGHGTQNARDEAAYLLLNTLGLPPGDLVPHLHRRPSTAEVGKFEELVARRAKERVPAAYLTREAWLGEHRFYVDERAIVPRSFISELLHDGLGIWLKRAPGAILDLCTGSGCLAILAALAFRGAHVDASDVSRDALAVARRNVGRYRLRGRVNLVRSDLYAGLPRRRYDLILANPPYVKASSMRALPREYRHEPSIALDGGTDGLALVNRILDGAAARLRPGGVLVCEIGHNRRALERAHPRLPFVWLDTSGGGDYVFLIEREALTR